MIVELFTDLSSRCVEKTIDDESDSTMFYN